MHFAAAGHGRDAKSGPAIAHRPTGPSRTTTVGGVPGLDRIVVGVQDQVLAPASNAARPQLVRLLTRGAGAPRKASNTRSAPQVPSTGVDSGLVWALGIRREQPVQRAEMRRYHQLFSRVAPLVAELCQEPSVMLRDGDEVVCA
jgi:hypothetical protein